MKAESAAFILHRQNYGETSKILRCFTREYGRIDIICKGCRQGGKQARIMEPFRRYRLAWSGRGELKTLNQADEIALYSLSTVQDRLYSGFYINELLSQIVKTAVAEMDLFDLYAKTLSELAVCPLSAIRYVLRRFELALLQSMGYGISLDVERDGQTKISPAQAYGFEPEHGLFATSSRQQILASGDTIIALREGKFENIRQEKEARRLMRFILGSYLPNTSIQSRKLFA